MAVMWPGAEVATQAVESADHDVTISGEVQLPETQMDSASAQIQEAHNDSASAQAPEKVVGTIYNKAVIEGKDGWLFYALDNAVADYQGTNLMSEAQMNRYLERMQELQNICTAQGKQLCFLIPPNKEQVYAEYMPDYPVKNAYKRVPRFVDYVSANSEIRIVYPLQEMTAAKFYCDTYLKHDTHWSNCGAFIGMQSVYQLLDLPTTPLYMQARSEMPSVGGDLIVLGKLNVEEYSDNYDYIINYKPEIECTSPQDFRFNEMIYFSQSTSENKSRIVVIGDSFCMKMTPFLMKDFSDVLVVHRSWLQDPDVLQAIRDADIIVIESLERMIYSLPGTSTLVRDILQTAPEQASRTSSEVE